MSGGYDPKATISVARDLEDVATKLDRIVHSLPNGVDAGPFSKAIQMLMEGVGANGSAAVIRMNAAADQAREAAARQTRSDEAQKGTIEDLLMAPLREHDQNGSGR